ncbi:MAG: hypothetical protein WD278_20935 [Pirellulales bacterium]
MDFNRNHYFMAGVFVLLLGLQLRLVDSFILNESATRFVNTRLMVPAGTATKSQFFPAVGPTPRKVVRPPEWLGWALMSVGSVLILHSLAMKAPGAS